MKNKILLLLLTIALFSCDFQRNTANQKIETKLRLPVIFDTDTNNELDDQHALAYLISNADVFDILGVTTNATPNGGLIEEHTKEAARVFSLLNIEDRIPLISGANDGFTAIKDQVFKPEFDGSKAVEFIISKSRNFTNNELVVLAVGKLTNIALAIVKEPMIKERIRVVWLGSNYPEPGEYNQDSDTAALRYILEEDVPFEIVLVRYGKATGAAAVYVQMEDVLENMPGLGPQAVDSVMGRHGEYFTCFGDYSVNLFEHADFYGDPPHRSLFDMVAVAVLKNPGWARSRLIPAPRLENGAWFDQPENGRKILIWKNFDKGAILSDFYSSISEMN